MRSLGYPMRACIGSILSVVFQGYHVRGISWFLINVMFTGI